MSSHLAVIYTTFPSQEDALNTTHQLLDKRLIACINILGSTKSIYYWKGTIHTCEEVAVFLKTTKDKVSSTITALQKLHPDETPAILEISIDQAAEPFKQWIQNTVK